MTDAPKSPAVLALLAEIDAFSAPRIFPADWAERFRDDLRSPTRSCANFSDADIADRVRMLMRNDLMHEAVVTAARDRIAFLTLELADKSEALRVAEERISELADGAEDAASAAASFKDFLSDG